jgi:D-alanyl-D-alanine dipeptidase
MSELVYLDEYGILGSNFYFQKGKEIGMTKEELHSVGLSDDRVMVHKDLIEPLKIISKEFSKLGYELYIKEGYRSKELYELVNQKMIDKLGEEAKNKILNMKDMPHSTGKSVDVALYKNGEHIKLHNIKDGVECYFIDFYKGKNDFFQDTQQMIIKIMTENGFELGKKGEYFHYNFVG